MKVWWIDSDDLFLEMIRESVQLDCEIETATSWDDCKDISRGDIVIHNSIEDGNGAKIDGVTYLVCSDSPNHNGIIHIKKGSENFIEAANNILSCLISLREAA